jgi:hypothetical protein
VDNPLGDCALIRLGGQDQTCLNCYKWTWNCGAHLLGQLLALKNSAAGLRAQADLRGELLSSAVTLPDWHPPAPHRQRVSYPSCLSQFSFIVQWQELQEKFKHRSFVAKLLGFAEVGYLGKPLL